jgi:hypothetical protein
MDRDQIDGAADEDGESNREGSKAAERKKPARPGIPKAPEAVSSEQVAYDQPKVEELVVGQGFEAQLQAEGHHEHGAQSQEEATMEPRKAGESHDDQEPLEAKGEADVSKDVVQGRWLYNVAPMDDRSSGRLYSGT